MSKELEQLKAIIKDDFVAFDIHRKIEQQAKKEVFDDLDKILKKSKYYYHKKIHDLDLSELKKKHMM